MAYFPFFIDVSGGEGLIVGGGRVALRKIEKLLPYEPRLTVCARTFLPEIEAVPGLTLLREPFRPSMAEEKLFVIAATDDPELNGEIAVLCRERRVPVNVVDDRERCTFLFPALVKRGPLSVGISTGGASPSGAVHWKREIDRLIPRDAGELLDYLDGLRETVKRAVPGEERRAAVFAALFDTCRSDGWPLEEERLERLLGGGEELS
nr:bifunctional precorrin-2 dehydrogenase/sirohydrochlorin ferrochelatase [uncultured Oscillibacter sp.]